MNQHAPVLLAETVDQLSVRADGVYLDATFGRGGHSRAILEQLGPTGRLLALDRDPEAAAVGAALAVDDSRFNFSQGRFGTLQRHLERHGVFGQVDGILLDLGVSSPQLDAAERGFSFLAPGPLDMRMDPSTGQSAADWLNSAAERAIADVLYRYGEEKSSRRIARAICERRSTKPITTTDELAAIIESVVPRKAGGKHPATRSFQAIRIFINDELEELEAALPQGVAALKRGGRFCVISFHSLEDRRVKRYFRDRSRIDPALARLPRVPDDMQPVLRVVGRAIRPGDEEIASNARARSARLRVAEKIR